MTARGSSGGEVNALVARIGPIWPDASAAWVSRRPRLGRPGPEYLVIPRLGNPILMIPASGVPARSSIRVAVPGLRGRALATAHRAGLLRRLPMARVRPDAGARAPALDALAELVPGVADVVVRLGRPRPGRAVVVTCLDDAGCTLAFGKLGTGPAKPGIAAEHEALRLLEGLDLTLVTPPRSLGYREPDGRAVLAMTALPGEPSSLRPDDPLLHAAMAELATAAGTTSLPLAQVPRVAVLRRRMAALPEQARWLAAELETLLARCGDAVLDVGLWHGDWVAWNQRRTARGVALWDWEHLEDGVPLGSDYLHYTAQQLRRLEGTGEREERRWLSVVRAGLRDSWGRSPEQIDASIVLYLLGANLRYAEERLGVSGAEARQGWTRELVRELNRR